MKYVSNSPEDTIALAESLAAAFTGSEVILLEGGLGAGKTTFTKGIASALGVSDIVTSPTFTIMNEYSGRLPLYHFDMYRITSEDELQELGLKEYLYAGGVAVIEWNKFDLAGIEKIITVRLENAGGSKRRITLE